MNSEIILSASIIAVVSSLTALLAYFRGEYLLDGGSSSSGSAWEIRKKAVYGFVALAVLLGVCASALYLLLAGILPLAAPSVFKNIGLTVTAVLILLIVVLRWRQGVARIAAMIVLAALWGLGYGYVLPHLLERAQ